MKLLLPILLLSLTSAGQDNKITFKPNYNVKKSVVSELADTPKRKPFGITMEYSRGVFVAYMMIHRSSDGIYKIYLNDTTTIYYRGVIDSVRIGNTVHKVNF